MSDPGDRLDDLLTILDRAHAHQMDNHVDHEHRVTELEARPDRGWRGWYWLAVSAGVLVGILIA